MDHGGFSTDDTHIACLIAVNGGTQVTVNQTVYNTQARAASGLPADLVLHVERPVQSSCTGPWEQDHCEVARTLADRSSAGDAVRCVVACAGLADNACTFARVFKPPRIALCCAQLAPTILTMLGLSPSSLTGVVAENTAVRR